MSKSAWAQTQAAPKLTQILREDLEGQGQVVQETVVSIVDFGPGAAAPWLSGRVERFSLDRINRVLAVFGASIQVSYRLVSDDRKNTLTARAPSRNAG